MSQTAPPASLRLPCGTRASDDREPSLAEMTRDPVFLQLLEADQVPMEIFGCLVATVRRRVDR